MSDSTSETSSEKVSGVENLPPFEEIQVSTKTFIVTTNLTLDIPKVFEFLPVTEYIIVQKKRGRKKKSTLSDPNESIPDGSIITLDLANRIRGVVLKKKKKNEGKDPKFFRNSMTVVMIMDGKKINFKLTRNGRFQMTGCKVDKQAEKCVKSIWEYIKDRKDELYTFSTPLSVLLKECKGNGLEAPKVETKKVEKKIGKCKKNVGKIQLKLENEDKEGFYALFIPAMRNIDFSMGFLIDRERLDEYFNVYTDYCSLLETSIGYTGVNIKIPVEIKITDLMITEISYELGPDSENEQRLGKWNKTRKVPYQRYLDQLKPKEQEKKLEKERFTTFLVFHSGKTICSSMCEDFARDSYHKFIKIIKENYKEFEEKLF